MSQHGIFWQLINNSQSNRVDFKKVDKKVSFLWCSVDYIVGKMSSDNSESVHGSNGVTNGLTYVDKTKEKPLDA